MKYCSVKCQKEHRPKHKKECKKRAAELKDEILFKQPESSHYGDCPICCVPLPIDMRESGLHPCCCKRICLGCSNENEKRELEGRLQHTCPFCRMALPKSEEEANELLMKRVEANDPVATCHMGKEKYDEGDFKSAFDYYSRAAAFGDEEAHYRLSVLYREGKGVENDEKKELYHLTEAAIGGHPSARHNLACFEGRNGRNDRAVKHYTIAANLGCHDSLNALKNGYNAGYVNKDGFTEALRGYQAAIEAMKSPQREAAAEFARWVVERRKRRGSNYLPSSSL